MVEVELEDAVLGELGLQQQGEHRFARLAAKGALPGEEERPRELLGDRARALGHPAGAQVVRERPGDGYRVDAVVAEKPVVLDGHDRRAQRRGNALERNFPAPRVEREPRCAPRVEEDGIRRTPRRGGGWRGVGESHRPPSTAAAMQRGGRRKTCDARPRRGASDPAFLRPMPVDSTLPGPWARGTRGVRLSHASGASRSGRPLDAGGKVARMGV